MSLFVKIFFDKRIYGIKFLSSVSLNYIIKSSQKDNKNFIKLINRK